MSSIAADQQLPTGGDDSGEAALAPPGGGRPDPFAANRPGRPRGREAERVPAEMERRTAGLRPEGILRGEEPPSERIAWDDFEKVDMRVGVVLRAEPFPEARRPAYKLWVDFGPLGEKRSSAQVTDYYRPEELVGRQVVCVVNFPPKQIGLFVSEVLVLGAYTNGREVVLLRPDRDVDLGSRIG